MMSDMPVVKTRDMLTELMKVVDAHRQVGDNIAEHAGEIHRARTEHAERTQSNEIVVPYGA